MANDRHFSLCHAASHSTSIPSMFFYSKQDGPFTNERGANGGGWQRVGDDDEEDGVSQQQSDLEGYSLSAVGGEVEAHYIHHHQEYAGEK